jgi:hypothetical protein
MLPEKRYLMTIALVLLLLATGSVVQPADAAARPIYVVSDWQDYLVMVPVSVHEKYTPLLFSESGLTAEILHFSELYDGSLLYVDAEVVQQIISEKWPRAETIVMAQPQQRLGLIASAIAASLDAPLFFELPSAAVLQQMQVKKIIVVGGPNTPNMPQVLQTVSLGTEEQALVFYNELVGRRPVAVLAADDNMGFLAAGVAAYHQGNLLFKPEDIREHLPRHLAWVTNPRQITKQTIYYLHEMSRFTEGSLLYDAGMGILTGFTPHDLSLLLARTYAYFELEGEWKEQFVTASRSDSLRKESISPVASSAGQPIDVVTLYGRQLTAQAFTEAISSSAYVAIQAHGDPGGFGLADGTWPGRHQLAGLPPVVFVAESCLTADIGGGRIGDSVVLRTLAAGAVAYVGSLEVGGVGLIGDYGFAYSTPSTPLGTLVRLQNASRLDIDADYARAVLFGDPTFHQYEQEFISYKIESEAGEWKVKISPIVDTGPVVVLLELPDDWVPNYAVAQRSGYPDESFTPGMVFFESSFSRATTFDKTHVLLEWPGGMGELTFYQNPPLSAKFTRFFSHILVGIKATFDDLLGQIGTELGVASFLIMAYIWRAHKVSRNWRRLWAGLLTGTAMSLLGIGFNVWFGAAVPLSVIAAASFGAAIVLWSVSPRQGEFKRIAACAALYILPLMLAWLIALLIGGSQRVLILIMLGILFVGLIHLLLVVGTLTLFRDRPA